MFCEKIVRDVAVDAMAALEEIGLQVLLGAEELPRAPRFGDGSLHVVDRKNVVANSMFNKARPRRNERREVAQFAQLQQARHEIARAVEDVKDALAPVAEVT